MAPGDAPPPPPSEPWPPPGQPQGQWPPPGPPAAPWPPVRPPVRPPAGQPPRQPAPGPGGPQTPWGGHWGDEEGRRPATVPRTSPLAVAALLCAALGWWLFGLGALAGIALGIVSLEQIQQSNGSLKGRGWAIAGIAVGAGFSLLFLWAIAVVHR